MIQKIKDTVIWVVGPLLAVFGFIYYLLTDRDRLKAELGRKDATQIIGDALGRKEDARIEAEMAEKNYKELLNKYNDPESGAGGDTDL